MTCQAHTHNRFTAFWILSGTTRVSRYQKKHSPSHTYCGHQSSIICFIHLLQSMSSSLFNLCASLFPQSLSKFSLVYLWLGTLHFMLRTFLHPIIVFFLQHMPIPLQPVFFCCSTEIMSSNSSLPLNSLLGTLSCNFTPHIHLTILISALWNATSFSFQIH